MSNENIEKMLEERGSRYGNFETHARLTQAMKDIFTNKDSKCLTCWDRLSPSQKEALEMVAHKIGRILNGDPNYLDSWLDIVGYVQLVVNELKDREAVEEKNPRQLIPAKLDSSTGNLVPLDQPEPISVDKVPTLLNRLGFARQKD